MFPSSCGVSAGHLQRGRRSAEGQEAQGHGVHRSRRRRTRGRIDSHVKGVGPGFARFKVLPGLNEFLVGWTDVIGSFVNRI